MELNWGCRQTRRCSTTAANAGFNAVRIPCAWDFNATTNISGGVTNYLINPAYMAQVKQTVDSAIAAGMYVMINDHWDDGWLENNIGTTVDPIINAKMKAYWTQIATTFAGYDNHLLFAAANEPNVNNPAEMDTLMFYYQTFVNAVRGVGGNNTNRWLVLQGGGGHDVVEFPADGHGFQSSDGGISLLHAVSVHDIVRAMHRGALCNTFGDRLTIIPATRLATAAAPEEGAIDSGFQQLVDQYVSKGIPVMIGEFQAAGKSVLAQTPRRQLGIVLPRTIGTSMWLNPPTPTD